MDTFWIFGIVAALLTGLGKTGVPGVGVVSVPVLAYALQTRFPETGGKDSVAWLLPMLIMADVLAVAKYWRHTDWSVIRRLAPTIFIGLVIGFAFYYSIPDEIFPPFMGVLVLFMVGLDFARRGGLLSALPSHPVFAGFIGVSTGVSTAVANLAGPVMNIYLLCLGIDKRRFMGTCAVLFFLVNCSKVPVFVAMGRITGESLLFDLTLLPAIGIGALAGIWLFPRVPQRIFDFLVTGFAILAALKLLFA